MHCKLRPKYNTALWIIAVTFSLFSISCQTKQYASNKIFTPQFTDKKQLVIDGAASYGTRAELNVGYSPINNLGIIASTGYAVGDEPYSIFSSNSGGYSNSRYNSVGLGYYRKADSFSLTPFNVFFEFYTGKSYLRRYNSEIRVFGKSHFSEEFTNYDRISISLSKAWFIKRKNSIPRSSIGLSARLGYLNYWGTYRLEDEVVYSNTTAFHSDRSMTTTDLSLNLTTRVFRGLVFNYGICFFGQTDNRQNASKHETPASYYTIYLGLSTYIGKHNFNKRLSL